MTRTYPHYHVVRNDSTMQIYLAFLSSALCCFYYELHDYLKQNNHHR